MPKGELTYCLSKLSEHPKDAQKIYEYFTSHGKISPRTINGWISGDYIPNGMNFIRVIHFLEEIGYQVNIFDNMPREVKELGKSIAFNKIAFDEAKEFLGYRNTSHFMAVLKGDQNIGFDKLDSIKKILFNIFGDELDDKVNTSVKNGIDKEKTLEIAKNLISGLLPIAELIASDSFNDDDRKNLRKISSEKIFLLSTALNKLCSRSVRDSQN